MTISSRAREPEQKADRRRAILDAALGLWQDSTYEQFTMSELAQSLGVAKGTLYLTFETKEELFCSLLDTMLTGWANELSTWLSALRVPSRPRQIAEVIGRSLQSRPQMLRLMPVVEVLPARDNYHSTLDRPLDLFANAVRGLERVMPQLKPAFARQFFDGLRALLIGYFARVEFFDLPRASASAAASSRLPASPVDEEFLLVIEALLEGYLKLSRATPASPARKRWGPVAPVYP